MTTSATTSRDQVTALTQEIKANSEPFRRIVEQVSHVLVGQEKLIHRMLIGLLTRGH